ncbi:MAG TPA: hypothetical protein VGN81_25905 [Pseudonocardiaceae bacterium]|jgi:hypothetical protein
MNAKMIARIAASVAVAAVLALGAEAAHTATHAQPGHAIVALADGGTTPPPATDTPDGPGSNPWE